MFQMSRVIREEVNLVLQDVVKTEPVLYVFSNGRFPDWWNIANYL